MLHALTYPKIISSRDIREDQSLNIIEKAQFKVSCHAFLKFKSQKTVISSLPHNFTKIVGLFFHEPEELNKLGNFETNENKESRVKF